MAKIKLEICCGTACYILGADKLLKLEDSLPAELLEQVEISASPCLNACLSDDLGDAPFVRLNGELISRATAEMLTERIQKLFLMQKEQ